MCVSFHILGGTPFLPDGRGYPLSDGRGYPHPSQLGGSHFWGGTPFLPNGSGVPPSFQMGYSHPSQGGVVPPIPGQDEGVPPSQVRTGGTPIQVRSQFRTRRWVPPTGTTQHILAMWRAVCFSRSRRRTFLLKINHCCYHCSTVSIHKQGTYGYVVHGNKH